MKFGLRDWATRDPDRIAAFCRGVGTSYGQLEETANRIAHLFRACGLQRGDHVAASVSNDPVVFALTWAAYRTGLYFTPISSVGSSRDVAYLVENSDAKLVLIDAGLPGLAEQLPPLVASSPHWFSVGERVPGFTDLTEALADRPTHPVADESPGALMMYTSGTTGLPKGVWRPLPTDPEAPPPFAGDLLALFDITAGSHYLSTAPLYHAAPLRFSLAFTAAGGTVHVMTKFDAAAALDEIETAGITHSQWVPTMFQRLLALPEERRARHSAPAHRVALHGAAPCPAPVKRAMIDWWGPILEEYYAGSESVGLCKLSSAEWLRKPGSVGRCVKGNLHILGDDWSELPPGPSGRIYFSGISRFEYYKAAEKTLERLSPQGYQTFGDIGHVDEDGFLFLTDRQDDMIISGGVNIYPQELEAALMEDDAVADCAVVGLPDPEYGERAVAFVVRRDGSLPDAEIVTQLQSHCTERLGRVKRPKEIRIVTEIPRTPTGKLQRRSLRDALSSAGSGEPRPN